MDDLLIILTIIKFAQWYFEYYRYHKVSVKINKDVQIIPDIIDRHIARSSLHARNLYLLKPLFMDVGITIVLLFIPFILFTYDLIPPLIVSVICGFIFNIQVKQIQ